MAKKERAAGPVADAAARKAGRGASPTAPTQQQQQQKKNKKLSVAEKVTQSSPIQHMTVSLYLALSPCAHRHPVEGLCAEHLSPHLLSYFPPLLGVLLGFDNARLSASPDGAADEPAAGVLAASVNEYAVSFVWLTCDVVVFRPSPGTYLEGEINVQNEGLLGLICYNYFNVSIPREKLPADWRWDGTAWQDAAGTLDRKMVCKVDDFEPSAQGGISISGTLLGL